MTHSTTFAEAANILLSRRTPGTKAARLATALRPQSMDDALAIQAEQVQQRRDNVSAWKCLLPIGENKFMVAPIFSDTVQRGAQCSLMRDNNVVRIEPEIAFVLNQDLPAQSADYSNAEIDNAIGSCHMALELMQARYADDSGVEFYESLADCLVNQGLYLGPEIDKTAAYAASTMQINVSQSGKKQTFAGQHPNQLPQNPVYWLINYMSKRGTDFKAGQAIITGSYAGVIALDFDQQTEIEYQGIGHYQVEFKEIQ